MSHWWNTQKVVGITAVTFLMKMPNSRAQFNFQLVWSKRRHLVRVVTKIVICEWSYGGKCSSKLKQTAVTNNNEKLQENCFHDVMDERQKLTNFNYCTVVSSTVGCWRVHCIWLRSWKDRKADTDLRRRESFSIGIPICDPTIKKRARLHFGGQTSVKRATFVSAIAVASGPSNLDFCLFASNSSLKYL